MRSRFTPELINLPRLFPQTESDAEPAAGKVTDGAQQSGDELGMGSGLDFAGLQDDGTVFVFVCPACHSQHGIEVKRITVDVRIAPPDAAVKTVLRAEIAHFDQTAQMNSLPRTAQLDPVSRFKKPLQLLRILHPEQIFKFFAGQGAGMMFRPIQ